MKTYLFTLFLALGLIVTPAMAEEYTSFVEWASVAGPPPGDPPPVDGFGDLLDAWSPGLASIVGIAYDESVDGIWFACEATGGILYCLEAQAPHGILRSIDILAFGWTGDGSLDGVAIDEANNRILCCDYQGDLTISDDIIYSIDYTTGALIDVWHVDGALNPNPNAFINTILGICVDGMGGIWVTNNEGLIRNVELLPGGDWNELYVGGVPGGGSWAGIDYDPCLNEFFMGNFATGVFQYHADPISAPLQQFNAPVAGYALGITSDGAGTVWTAGFGDDGVYVHEGIACGGTPVNPASWGQIKGLFR